MSIEAMKMALEALEDVPLKPTEWSPAVEALRQAIEQAEKQEPADIECTCKAANMPFGRCCKAVEQKPVGWMYTINDKVGEVSRMVCLDRYNLQVTSPYGREGIDYAEGMIVKEFPVYTAAPQRQWVKLTRDERMDIINRLAGQDWVYAVDAIEAKLKEKNQ